MNFTAQKLREQNVMIPNENVMNYIAEKLRNLYKIKKHNKMLWIFLRCHNLDYTLSTYNTHLKDVCIVDFPKYNTIIGYDFLGKEERDNCHDVLVHILLHKVA